MKLQCGGSAFSVFLFAHDDDDAFARTGTRAVKIDEVAVAGCSDAELAVGDIEGLRRADESCLEVGVAVPECLAVAAREVCLRIGPALDRAVMLLARILVLVPACLVGDDLLEDGVQIVLQELGARLVDIVHELLEEDGAGRVRGDDRCRAFLDAALGDGRAEFLGDVDKGRRSAVGFERQFLLEDRHISSPYAALSSDSRTAAARTMASAISIMRSAGLGAFRMPLVAPLPSAPRRTTR